MVNYVCKGGPWPGRTLALSPSGTPTLTIRCRGVDGLVYHGRYIDTGWKHHAHEIEQRKRENGRIQGVLPS